jgi:hypothetical protein
MLTNSAGQAGEPMPEDAADFAFTTHVAFVADRRECRAGEEIAR